MLTTCPSLKMCSAIFVRCGRRVCQRCAHPLRKLHFIYILELKVIAFSKCNQNIYKWQNGAKTVCLARKKVQQKDKWALYEVSVQWGEEVYGIKVLYTKNALPTSKHIPAKASRISIIVKEYKFMSYYKQHTISTYEYVYAMYFPLAGNLLQRPSSLFKGYI